MFKMEFNPRNQTEVGTNAVEEGPSRLLSTSTAASHKLNFLINTAPLVTQHSY